MESKSTHFKVVENPFVSNWFPRKHRDKNSSNQCMMCAVTVRKGSMTFSSPHCRICGQMVCSKHSTHRLKKEKVCDECYVIYNRFEKSKTGTIKVPKTEPTLDEFLKDGNLEQAASNFHIHQVTIEELLNYQHDDDIRQFGEDIDLDSTHQNRLVEAINNLRSEYESLDNPFSSNWFPREKVDESFTQCIICAKIVKKGLFEFGSPHCRMCGQLVCSEHGMHTLRKEKVCDKCYKIYESFEYITDGTVKVWNKKNRNDQQKYRQIYEKIKNRKHNEQCKKRFDVGKAFASGGFGSVHKAIDNRTDRGVAIKKIMESKERSFLTEVALMKSCDHDNIMPIDEIYHDEKGGEYCIVMEFCVGSIENKIRKCSDFEILHIAHDVLSALVYLHERNIIHRDIKPANILVDSSGLYKLCDFGVGKNVEQTLANTVIGTPCYWAPEIAYYKYSNTMNYDKCVDIFSFGQTIFALITGGPLKGKYSENTKPKITKIKKYFKQMAIQKCIQINPALRSTADSLLITIKEKFSMPEMMAVWAKGQNLTSSTVLKSIFQQFSREFIEKNVQTTFDSFSGFGNIFCDQMMDEFGMFFDVQREINELYKLISPQPQNEEKENDISAHTKLKFVKIPTLMCYGDLNGDIKKYDKMKKCATSLCVDGNSLTIDHQNKVYKIVNGLTRLLIHKSIVNIACGEKHCLLLAKNGCLFTYGSNAKGQCLQNERFVNKPKLCIIIGKIVHIAAGHSHSTFIHSDGFAYAFGDNESGQCGVNKDVDTRVQQKLPINARHISCGAHHTMLISTSHKLFSCGYNYFGSVGNGTDKNQFTLSPIHLPHDVVDADCGSSHSLCVLSNGDAYSWGYGSDGRLGHGNDTSNKYFAAKIHVQQAPIKFIRCFAGCAHSALLDDENNLYTFGMNKNGELCHKDKESKLIPTKVPNMRVIDAVLGLNKTFLFVANRGVSEEKIEMNNVYDVYAQNKHLFGADHWIKVRQNEFRGICEDNDDQKSDDELLETEPKLKRMTKTYDEFDTDFAGDWIHTTLKESK